MPRQNDLALQTLHNTTGFSISRLPNGALFALKHERNNRQIMINQVLGSPIAGGMGQIYIRTGGVNPATIPTIGPNTQCRIGATQDRFIWDGETNGLHHSISLWLHPEQNLWLWHVDITNLNTEALPFDVVFVQDIGLGEQGFLMGNEAYASQYLDHFIAKHAHYGKVLINRQNLLQNKGFPWVAHGCLEASHDFATDFRQIMGPSHRDADQMNAPFGVNLPSIRLQYETACAALQTQSQTLLPQASASLGFFGLFSPDHPAASSNDDLSVIDTALAALPAWQAVAVELAAPARSILQDAPALVADSLDPSMIDALYPQRTHEERAGGVLLSFFTPTDTHSRHIVLRDKERLVVRRHGEIMRSGAEVMPSDKAMSVTCWMHGVFAAQLTIGNTSFHQLFSISRDPYNINRGSGLRILAELDGAWRLLTVPSAFEMGLGDCRWIYKIGDRVITVSVVISGEDAALQGRVTVAGEPCQFMLFGHLTLGEREYDSVGHVTLDAAQKRFTFQPDADGIWGKNYPQAAYHLVTSTPDMVATLGGDELLYSDGQPQGGAYIALRTHPTASFTFAVTGSMTDTAKAEQLAAKYATPIDAAAMLAPASTFWAGLTRQLHLSGHTDNADVAAINNIFPWLVHDAMIHLTAPHGLEQYTGAAWGTRDVCQGPLELFLSLEHDDAAKDVLRVIFAQQYVERGDWPQWFMLEPYSVIQDKHAHGDVIVWPLKALCDYIEATGDLAFLNEHIAWRREDNFEKTNHTAPVIAHIEKLVATVRQRFVSGTHLIQYGNGDWNDSLQPVDLSRRDWMVSSWTVALLYQQLCRYAEILTRAGHEDSASAHKNLAQAMRQDFETFLIRDKVVAGYALFEPNMAAPTLLLHPSDPHTGVHYSLLPMIQAIVCDLFTPEQSAHHRELIRDHLAFADGVRLMDKPIRYHGGTESIFRRAESAAFFGREIGLMYVHSHLRYAEAMAKMGEGDALWNALLVVNPIAVTEHLPNASLRQRNAYFSSSDAAFNDRYQSKAQWHRVKDQTIAVDGGWRIYSSGPGLYANMLIQHALGRRRNFGAPVDAPCLPATLQGLKLRWH
eukprot:gene10625-10696_t